MRNTNFWTQVLVVAALALSASLAPAEPLSDLSGGQTGRIEYQSSSPNSRWAVIRNNQGPEVTVYGDLLMPKNVSGKVPAVVFSHGSEGVSSLYFDVWARAMNDAGIAVFVVDSFKPRGIDNITGPEKQLSYNGLGGNIADALYGLKLLATHPQIDANRIFHMGWSRGGSAAVDAAWPTYQQHILPLTAKWAGTIAAYPGCTMRHRTDQHSKLPSPMLFVLGEKDNMTPAQPCVDYAKELAAKGDAATYRVYAGAYHGFDRLNQSWRQSKQGSFADCSLDVWMPFGAGDKGWKGGENRLTGKVLATAADYQDATKQCQKVIYSTSESNPKAREQAVADVLAFIKEH